MRIGAVKSMKCRSHFAQKLPTFVDDQRCNVRWTRYEVGTVMLGCDVQLRFAPQLFRALLLQQGKNWIRFRIWINTPLNSAYIMRQVGRFFNVDL